MALHHTLSADLTLSLYWLAVAASGCSFSLSSTFVRPIRDRQMTQEHGAISTAPQRRRLRFSLSPKASELVLKNPLQPGPMAEDDIILPTLKYGYRKEPLEWPELVEIIQVEQNLDKLARNEDQQRTYMLYMRDLKKKWRTVIDFVLCSKFDLEKRTGNDNLWFAFPPLSEFPGVHLKLVQNDFPYYLGSGVEHWILWKLGGDCTEKEIEEAEESLKNGLGDVSDILHWINPPRLKSFPELDHAHILLKREHRRME